LISSQHGMITEVVLPHLAGIYCQEHNTFEDNTNGER